MTRIWLIIALTSACAQDVGTSTSAITGGTPESGYAAVFSLAYQGEGMCSGTCITPKVGLTATHCIEGSTATGFTGLFGSTETAPTKIIKVTAATAGPSGSDIAALAFAEACPAVIPYNRTKLEDHIGEPVVMVGFGVTTESANDAGIKRSGTATLFSVTPSEVPGMENGELATSNDPDGTCNGDSGGPTFMTFGGTEYLIGTTSRGSLMNQTTEWPCGQGRSIAVRADAYSTFIDGFIAQYDPSSGDPGGDPGGDNGSGSDEGGSGSGANDDPSHGGCSTGRGTSLLGMAALVVVLRRRRRR